ncbi:MAG: hypothetical protein JXA41_05640 [Deltaproteobacteria bacterium]|nr:hypothetical protein [Deltaproteobacteria bacterium]
MQKVLSIALIALLVIPCISHAETIDVQIKGVDDGIKTTKQQDYKEAVLFAKREAIERAGVRIKAITNVKDLVLNSDYIESKAEALLLPGYNIIDVGYQQDGTYLVILVGKVETVQEGIETKELRYAKSLVDRKEKNKAEDIITDIIKNSKDDDAVAEAMYYKIVWGLGKGNENEIYEKLKAYYPNSKYIAKLDAFLKEKEFVEQYCKCTPVRGSWGAVNLKRLVTDFSREGSFIGLDKSEHRIKADMSITGDSNFTLYLYIDRTLVRSAVSNSELITRRTDKNKIELNCSFTIYSLGERFCVTAHYRFYPKRSLKYPSYSAGLNIERLDCPKLPDMFNVYYQ